MINYKKILFPVLTCVLVMMMGSCKETNGFNDIISTDKTKPDVVSNVRVENFNGGAHLVYDLPKSDNILYVVAKYKINDQVNLETKASYYSDTLTVNGFAKAADYDVTLYTVSRANVMSDPLTVKVSPLKPIFELVLPTLSLSADYGGVRVTGTNELTKEVRIFFVAFDDNTQLMEVQNQQLTNVKNIEYTVNDIGYAKRKFGVYIADQWGNRSDTVQAEITPIYDEPLDKGRFTPYNLNSDSPIGFNWVLTNLWNGKADGDGWHTTYGLTAPFVCSFGVGKSYSLTRFRVFSRIGSGFLYDAANVKDFALWGSNVDRPADVKLPVHAPEGTVLGDWVCLGNYNFPPPPSGLPPARANSADEAFVKAGVNFNMTVGGPAVKFVRLAVQNTWGNPGGAYMMELSLYGNPQ